MVLLVYLLAVVPLLFSLLAVGYLQVILLPSFSAEGSLRG
jgi:hypothetical protein